MCIIILNTKGKLPKETLKTCYENNSDGMGLMFSDGKKLQSHKELKNFDSFYEVYAKIRERNPKANIGLHFRIKTHGMVNLENCHPFEVNPKLYFMHNGIIRIESKNPNLSDTFVFNERILKGLKRNFLNNHSIIELIENYIGYSKLLFMNNKGEYKIINENLGVWKSENWFSNYTYQKEERKYLSDDYYYGCELTEDEFDDCDECGKPLLSKYESELGLCHKCIRDYRVSNRDFNYN